MGANRGASQIVPFRLLIALPYFLVSEHLQQEQNTQTNSNFCGTKKGRKEINGTTFYYS